MQSPDMDEKYHGYFVPQPHQCNYQQRKSTAREGIQQSQGMMTTGVHKPYLRIQIGRAYTTDHDCYGNDKFEAVSQHGTALVGFLGLLVEHLLIKGEKEGPKSSQFKMFNLSATLHTCAMKQ